MITETKTINQKGLSIGFDFDLPDLSIDISKMATSAIKNKEGGRTVPDRKPRKPKKQTQLEIF